MCYLWSSGFQARMKSKKTSKRERVASNLKTDRLKSQVHVRNRSNCFCAAFERAFGGVARPLLMRAACKPWHQRSGDTRESAADRRLIAMTGLRKHELFG